MKKILIVDDNVAMLRLYQFHFKSRGWEGHLFEDGNDAIASLEEFKPDVAILDYDLKGMFGTDVFAAVSDKFGEGMIPVIFITAQIRSEVKEELQALPNASILNKPFSPAHLVQAIDALFEE
jgi:CheY-like chemotaxis protein